MMKKRISRNPVADRQLNSLLTNVESMVKNGDSRYNVEFINFCLDKIKERYGQNKRSAMCSLIMGGLVSNLVYDGAFDTLKQEFEKLKGGSVRLESGFGDAAGEIM